MSPALGLEKVAIIFFLSSSIDWMVFEGMKKIVSYSLPPNVEALLGFILILPLEGLWWDF